MFLSSFLRRRQGFATTGILLTIALFALNGCEKTPQIQKTSGYAQGTTYHISWWSTNSVSTKSIEKQFADTLASIDKELSTYRDDSYISRFNTSPSTDWQHASKDFIHLVQTAQLVNEQTHGCYDPTIGPLFSLWGFKKNVLEVPSQAQITAVQKEIGLDKIEIDPSQQRIRKTLPSVELDFSSMGEGYTIGKLSHILEANGITNYLVEFGGDMKIRGHKPQGQKWRIAIERPIPQKDGIKAYKIITINDENGVTLDTSGTYHHSFDANGKEYSHILDPRTGAPVAHHLVSASVFGTTPELSDAWATAMLCLGPDKGYRVAEREGLEVFFIESIAGKLSNKKSAALKNSIRVKFDQQ